MELIYEKRGRGIRFPNLYYDCGDHIKIKMWNATKEYFILIDKEDFDIASQCNWKIREDSLTVYALNSNNGFLHRVISKPQDGFEVDHIDGNGLNNRRSNLRNVTGAENSRNKTSVEGVFYEDGKYPRWRCIWREDGRQKSKSFSIRAYGEEAEVLARELRAKIEKEVYHRPLLTN